MEKNLINDTRVLATRYAKGLLNKFGLGYGLAEDVVQDFFLTLFSDESRCERFASNPTKRFVFMGVRNALTNHLRNGKQLATVSLPDFNRMYLVDQDPTASIDLSLIKAGMLSTPPRRLSKSSLNRRRNGYLPKPKTVDKVASMLLNGFDVEEAAEELNSSIEVVSAHARYFRKKASKAFPDYAH